MTSDLKFTCPAWCSMRMAPEDHGGADGTDVTRVLHMGHTAGLSLPDHTLMRNVGFEMDLYSYSLPTGEPGRPFVRLADDDVEGDHFDLRDVEQLQGVRDALIASLAAATEFLHEIQTWDRSATDATRALAEADRQTRPCRSSAGRQERCARCNPDGASPGELLWMDLMDPARL